MLLAGCVTQFLAPVLEGTIHLVVFRAAATGMVHRDDGGRGIEPSSRGNDGRMQEPESKPILPVLTSKTTPV